MIPIITSHIFKLVLPHSKIGISSRSIPTVRSANLIDVMTHSYVAKAIGVCLKVPSI